jgi:hypothetical protein
MSLVLEIKSQCMLLSDCVPLSTVRQSSRIHEPRSNHMSLELSIRNGNSKLPYALSRWPDGEVNRNIVS